MHYGYVLILKQAYLFKKAANGSIVIDVIPLFHALYLEYLRNVGEYEGLVDSFARKYFCILRRYR